MKASDSGSFVGYADASIVWYRVHIVANQVEFGTCIDHIEGDRGHSIFCSECQHHDYRCSFFAQLVSANLPLDMKEVALSNMNDTIVELDCFLHCHGSMTMSQKTVWQL